MIEPYYTTDRVTLYHGDCLDVLRTLPDASVDAVVTDPPYNLTAGKNSGGGFMGRSWDASGVAFDPQTWRAVLRVLKPGGHLLAFGGTRTWHRLVCAVEDAGFEIRDSIAWLNGQGFAKSRDVSKAIDEAAGATREVVGQRDRYHDGHARQNLGDRNEVYGRGLTSNGVADVTAPATDDAARWQGWHTALKPAHEPIVVARKPLAAGTVAANVVEHGTGALNIDACRIATTDADKAAINAKHAGMSVDDYKRTPGVSLNLSTNPMPLIAAHAHEAGRWAPNVVLDESQAAELDRQTGTLTSGSGVKAPEGKMHGFVAGRTSVRHDGAKVYAGDSGGASRFFYVAKAPSSERPRSVDGAGHPTVKPLTLMRWLVRLVTPPGGTVLDPFIGSGTTAEACLLEGFRCVGIDADLASMQWTVTRLTKHQPASAAPAEAERQATTPSLFDLEETA